MEVTPHVRSERRFTISTTFVLLRERKHGLCDRDNTTNTPTKKNNITRWILHTHSTSLASSR